MDFPDDDGVRTSCITATVVALTALLGVMSAPVVAAVLYVLVKYHHDGPFFALYKIGLVADIVMLLAQMFVMVQTRLLSSAFIETEPYRMVGSRRIPMKRKPFHVHNFAQYFLHTYQAFANGYLCFNRATAVLIPVHHHRLWSNRATLAVLCLAQFFTACLNGAQSLQLERRVEYYSTGERFLISLNRPNARAVWLRTFIVMVGGDSAIIILYGVVLWKFRMSILKNLKHALSSIAEEIEDRHAVSLLFIAVAVVAMEIFYCFFYYLSFIARISAWDDSRVWFAYYFGINCLYSCLPSYLLIIFSSSIRRQVTAVFLCGGERHRREPGNTSKSVNDLYSSRVCPTTIFNALESSEFHFFT